MILLEYPTCLQDYSFTIQNVMILPTSCSYIEYQYKLVFLKQIGQVHCLKRKVQLHDQGGKCPRRVGAKTTHMHQNHIPNSPSQVEQSSFCQGSLMLNQAKPHLLFAAGWENMKTDEIVYCTKFVINRPSSIHPKKQLFEAPTHHDKTVELQVCLVILSHAQVLGHFQSEHF